MKKQVEHVDYTHEEKKNPNHKESVNTEKINKEIFFSKRHTKEEFTFNPNKSMRISSHCHC
jgi:hypothetical protein